MDATSAILGKLRTICEYASILKPRPYCSFRFLDLPAEIRLLIYQELFGGSRAHMVAGWEQPVPTQSSSCEPYEFRRREERALPQLAHLDHDNTSCRFQSAVLRSCRTVYDEALPILYANPVFNISMFAGETGTLPLINAAHIRRIMTDALWQQTMNEQKIAEGYRLAGIQWDNLLLFAIDMGRGLGSGIARLSPNESLDEDSITRAVCGQATPVEYMASDVEWLFKANTTSELKRYGVCFKPFPESWYIRKGSTRLHDSSLKNSAYYASNGSRLHVLNYPWATA